jgi:hypothetical protein
MQHSRRIVRGERTESVEPKGFGSDMAKFGCSPARAAIQRARDAVTGVIVTGYPSQSPRTAVCRARPTGRGTRHRSGSGVARRCPYGRPAVGGGAGSEAGLVRRLSRNCCDRTNPQGLQVLDEQSFCPLDRHSHPASRVDGQPIELEASIAVTGHVDLDRAHVGEHGPGPGAVARVAVPRPTGLCLS